MAARRFSANNVAAWRKAPRSCASLITHRYPSLDAVSRAFAGEHTAPDYVKGVCAFPSS